MKLDVGILVDDKFEVLDVKGHGANGSTFVAKQRGLDRTVILKTLNHADAGGRLRFLREAYALSLISHPNVVGFYGYGIWEQQPYLAMELVEGADLDALLSARQTLPASYLMSIARQIAAGLECLHNNGIVHRDLTPRNVIIGAFDRSAPLVKIIDLGLAKLVGNQEHFSANQVTEAGQAIGSVLYMSPEQCRGVEAASSSDVYALGCIIYRLFAGRPPYGGDSAITLMLQHTEAAFPKLPGSAGRDSDPLMRRLNSLIEACVVQEPTERPAAAEVIKELDSICASVSPARLENMQIPTQSTSDSLPSPVVPILAAQKSRVPVGLFVGCAILCVVAGSWGMGHSQHADTLTHVQVLERQADEQVRRQQVPKALLTLEQAAAEAQSAGHWDEVERCLAQAMSCMPVQQKHFSPAFEQLAKSFYMHSGHGDGGNAASNELAFRLAVGIVLAETRLNQQERARAWFERASQNTFQLHQPSNVFCVSDLLCSSSGLADPRTLAQLGEAFFSSMRLLLLAKSPILQGHVLALIRQPLDVCLTVASIRDADGRRLVQSARACFVAARSYAGTPADLVAIDQYEGQVCAAIHDFRGASHYLKQAIANETDSSRSGTEAVRRRVEFAHVLNRLGQRQEATEIALDAVRLSRDADDPRAGIVALREYASLLAAKNPESSQSYEMSKAAFVAACDYVDTLTKAGAANLALAPALRFYDDAGAVREQVLQSQHKFREASQVAQQMDEKHRTLARALELLKD